MAAEGDDTQPAMTYPTTEQYEQWKDRADDMGMSVSEFMQAMIEAGWKKFDVDVDPDKTNHELRQQRNDLRDELEHARNRIEELEDQLFHTEREEIKKFVRKNPGATWDEIVDRLDITLPERTTQHLDDLEGRVLQRDSEDRYYIREDDE